MKLSDFDYSLQKEFIAQKPTSPRDHSKLMIINNKIEHKKFYNIIDYLKKDDVLVINETKVIPAKLKGSKLTGGKVELIVREFNKNQCKCILKIRNPKIGTKMRFGKYSGELIGIEKESFIVKFDENIDKIMKQIGELPTPPYVKRKIDKNSQYQTVYSKKKGSVAAPTAGLHFTKILLEKIKKKGVKIAKVCLHIDYGTFLPVRDITKKTLHEEYFEVDKKNADIINNRKGKLFVVGTTSVRTLESAADKNGKIIPKKGKTDIFIKPGYKFKTNIDALITNFHLPKSTLLMLVSAFIENYQNDNFLKYSGLKSPVFIGRKKILKAYKTAVKNKYRFFSFGDAMLLFRTH